MPVVLITGASSGIGAALAARFAADGYTLVLAGRDEARLAQVAEDLAAAHGARGLLLPVDLAGLGAVDEIFDLVQSEGLEVDVLVNNAGFGVYGAFADSDGAAEEDMVQVNVAALTALTKRFLPAMLARGSGRILNVASTAAFLPGPRMAVYFATKAYVLSFSEALGVELEGTGVTVTTLCPGPTATGFAERGGVAHTQLFRNAMGVETVADAGYRGMLAGRPVVVPGVRNAFGAFLTRFVPRRVAARIAQRLQR